MKDFFNKLIAWFLSFFKAEEPVENEGGQDDIETVEPVDTAPETNDDNENDGTVTAPVIIIPNNNKRNMVILLDNGHAASTPGKRSPITDNGEQFFEYEFNRDVVRRISHKLDILGIKYEILVPEVDEDISLSRRAARANEMCDKYGADRCLFLSIHANAAGDGSRWMTAKGWSCFTSKGETESDPYAEVFMQEAEKVLAPMGRIVRKYSQKKYSWEENFTVLVKTRCPAILTENMFYDNKEEMRFLSTDAARDAMAQIHVNAILRICNDQF